MQERHNPHLDDYEMFMPAEPKPVHGFYYNWGHQAIFSYLFGKAAMKRLVPFVPHTLVQIIKLCADSREDVEEAFKKIQELNENIRFFDSPYEKYRKMYGNYIRGVEWCCLQLRKYFNKRAYEELIIETTYSYNYDVMGKYGDTLTKMMLMGRSPETIRKEPGKLDAVINRVVTRILNFTFKHILNLTFWLVGDATFESYNVRTGEMELKVTDCLMLRAPRMRQLPEESCLLRLLVTQCAVCGLGLFGVIHIRTFSE